jgi:hypothetical protein
MKPAAVQAQGTRGQEQPGGFASPPIQTSGGPLLRLGVYDFRHVCAISPVREQDGSVREYLPQTGSANAEGLPLHKYGRGPFCKFTIPANLEVPGVYALVARGQVLYIGECAGLSSRYNMGYGNISPRNCFVGGQQTNCRINNLILQQAKAGAGVDLWFNETNNYKAIEQELREAFRPSWNRV